MRAAQGMALVAGAVVGAAVWHVDRERLSPRGESPSRPLVLDPAGTGGSPIGSGAGEAAIFPAVLPSRLPSPDPPYHGVAIQVNWAENAVAIYGRLIQEVADLGADTVLLSVNGYQADVESTRIAPDPRETPADDDWLELFAAAHRHGLRVVLMPKVLLSDPRGSSWRGKIQPASWDEWFAQYEAFVVPFARLAERGRVEVFIVGSELISTEKLTDPWRKLIAGVRAVFSGRLTYSANWDHYKGVLFWDDLDLIGMTTYHKLADDPGPALDDLRARWTEIKAGILDWQQDVGKPLLFTEAGWCSQEGCSIEAWNYYHQEKATPAGRSEQRDCYQAFVDTWMDAPQVGGIVWWEWTYGAGGDEDYGYTPKNKPAESILRKLFSHAQARRKDNVPASGPVGRSAG